MPKRIPVLAVSKFAHEHKCRQVIVVAWDGDKTHIVTYGVTKKECEMAAHGGKVIARALGLEDNPT
jgi:hypothetical protein